MDQEEVTVFLKKVVEDGDLRQRMEQAGSPEECLEIVNACGFDFEPDEFKDLMGKVLIMIKRETGQELTDQELALVAGGLSDEEEALIGAGIIVGSAAAGAAIVVAYVAATAAI